MNPTYDKYTVTQYSVNSILGSIESGEIAIPEIQRPFVWRGSQVRDLIDSLYNGYPTGYLIIWQNPTVRLKDGSSATGKKVLIDGQQRITAIMTAIAGQQILTEDYIQKTIRIAFNPLADNDESRFEVQTPIHLKDKKWIPDISEIFKPDFDSFSFIQQYIQDNPGVNSADINREITKLSGIKNSQIGAIMLVPELDIGEVTEIFVRINSQGKRLNQADFAMSKIAADEKYGGNMLRKAIDYFCHLAVDPAFYGTLKESDKEFMASEYAPKLSWLKDDNGDIYDPDFGDMLRVSFMHKFGRGKLGDLVSLLSGRNFIERTYEEDIAQESFSKLHDGVINFMNEYNFQQFVLAIRAAGFISSKLLNSQMTLDFAYTLFLILQYGGEVDKVQIKRYVQKWVVLSTLTGRYINSPESKMDQDLRRINEKGFLNFMQETEAAVLSEDFWNVGLVQNLETSAISSPYFNVFLAAQIYLKDRSLLSGNVDVEDLVAAMGDVHHIFPKQYLKDSGITDKARYNQVANYTYLDTSINIAVGKKAPNEYFRKAKEQSEGAEGIIGTLKNIEDYNVNLEVNCIPPTVIDMDANDYDAFLGQRRVLMAQKIKRYYNSL